MGEVRFESGWYGFSIIFTELDRLASFSSCQHHTNETKKRPLIPSKEVENINKNTNTAKRIQAKDPSPRPIHRYSPNGEASHSKVATDDIGLGLGQTYVDVYLEHNNSNNKSRAYIYIYIYKSTAN